MAAREMPDRAALLKLLTYDADTGKLFWKERPVHVFHSGNTSKEHNAKTWNNRHAGREVAPCRSPKGSRGYAQMTIMGAKYRVHRIIWKLVTGEEPIEVDHIDGNRTNNRWANLRSISRSENAKNRAMVKRNTSGASGVFWSKQTNRWQAWLSVDGKRKHLGLFKDRGAAILARKSAERKSGYHPNHGRKMTERRK